MTIKGLSVTEARRRLPRLVHDLELHPDHVFRVTVRGREVAELKPLPAGRRLGDLPALLKSLPPLSPKEAGAFAADVARARGEMNRRKARDPWAS